MTGKANGGGFIVNRRGALTPRQCVAPIRNPVDAPEAQWLVVDRQNVAAEKGASQQVCCNGPFDV
jgi:hypothetical protein